MVPESLFVMALRGTSWRADEEMKGRAIELVNMLERKSQQKICRRAEAATARMTAKGEMNGTGDGAPTVRSILESLSRKLSLVQLAKRSVVSRVPEY